MKVGKQSLRKQKRMDSNELKFREVGKGFIISRPEPGIVAGRRLATAYVDQFDRQYVQVDGAYELITDQHGYLAIDYAG